MTERWRYRSWSIGAKTLASHMALALFAIVFACVIAYALSYRYVHDKAIANLIQQVEFIAQNDPQSGDTIEIPDPEKLVTYQNLTDSIVFYVDRDYVAMHAPSTYPRSAGELRDETQTEAEFTRTQIISGIDQQFIARIFNNETVSDIRQFGFTSGIILFAGAPVHNTRGEIIGGVILAQPIAMLRELTAVLRLLLILTAAVTLIVAVVMALKMSQFLTRPIRKLTQTARRISEGEYGARIALNTYDELGELGNTLNSLSGRLSDVIERLREERDKLELIVSGIGEGIIAVDADYNIVHYNQAFLTLMEIEKMAPPPLEDEDGPRPLLQVMQKCMQTGQRQRAGWENKSQRKLAAFVSPLFGERGDTIGAVCLLQDVSESERLEQLRREYVANISHELRTPLTGIRGMVEPLLDGYIETEQEKQDCYRVIYQETLRLEKLVRDMLDMSRLQDGRVQIDLERLELPGIIDAAARRMKAIADEAQVRLVVDTGGERLSCVGNEDRILQVLIIFLDNALSFTPPGGVVTIFAREEENCVRLGVRDTGTGIEPKDLPYIWERFYKADKSRMRTSGTGLGLAVAKRIVELMGGAIGVDTERGMGSEFFFTLRKNP